MANDERIMSGTVATGRWLANKDGNATPPGFSNIEEVPSMSLTVSSRASARLSCHLLFVAFALASVALFWLPLHQLVSLSLDDSRYSHLAVVLLISAFFFYRERHDVFAGIATAFRFGLPWLAASLFLYGLLALRVIPTSSNYALTLLMLTVVAVWVSGFGLCYGPKALRLATFPFLLLLLLVPVPFNIMDWIISVLQRGASELTYLLLSLADVSMFRQGTTFQLPGIGIEVAKECSAIHSGWALFITGILVGHIFLRSIWPKIALAALTVPIAMFTNAVRIVILWSLGTKVDLGFLTGDLHRRGGILFSLISLSILLGFLAVLRRLDQPSHLYAGRPEAATTDSGS